MPTTASLLALLSGLALSAAAPRPAIVPVPLGPRYMPRHIAVRVENATFSNQTIVNGTSPLANATYSSFSPAAAVSTTFCSVHCDTLDPSQAQSETFPVADANPNGRVVRLHISDVDAMGWASIDGGLAGDQVWIDRSFDGGSTWDGLLGMASIPSSWTGTRTLMYNLADPDNHRRGMIRACGNGGVVACTQWVHMQACDLAACDGGSASTATGTYQPVPATTLSGRTISLFMDSQGMAWGTITGGAAGDAVWLDRSWDLGSSWAGGSQIGFVNTPSGASSTQTVLFSTRDVHALLYGGAVRACGTAVTGNAGSCTSWARPSDNQAAAAANALMWPYQPDTAWWLSSWWNSAVAVTTLMDYMIRTKDQQYLWVVSRTFNVNKVAMASGVKSSDTLYGDFISQATDDVLWWGVAWSTAYDLTGNATYLAEAQIIADYASGLYDTSTCNGGIWWNTAKTYKNAVTIGLYIKLSARLHNQIPGDTTYLGRATAAWSWFLASGMINSNFLVNDGQTSSCTNNGGTVYSYNQGLAIGAGIEIYRATKASNALYANNSLATAQALANASMSNTALTVNGILTESCDTLTSSCDDNGKQFKGIFMRYMMDLADVTGVATYRTYATTQAASLWNNDRDTLNQFGERWSGGTSSSYPNVFDWRTQASALGGLLAALPAP